MWGGGGEPTLTIGKKLVGECAQVHGQVTQTIKHLIHFVNFLANEDSFLFSLEIYGAVIEFRKALTAVCCHSGLKDSML